MSAYDKDVQALALKCGSSQEEFVMIEKEAVSKKLKIIRITDGEDPVLDVLSRWIYDWWGKDQNRTVPQIRDFYRRAVFEDRLPQTFVAFDGETPVGTFQFGVEDCYVRPDIYPWIKNVYVDGRYRGKGYAGEMLREAVIRAKEIGLKEVYLFTHVIGLYEKYGWEFVETFQTHIPELGMQRLYVQKL